MKRYLLAAALVAATAPALAADVGVSVSIGDPGFYGRIDIGNAPPPRLIYAEPVVVVRQANVVYQPVYIHVPVGHEKNWKKHCKKYDACGRPVYFVQNSWYNDVYVPHHHKGGGKGNKGHGKKDKD